jgi:hypothetical protein
MPTEIKVTKQWVKLRKILEVSTAKPNVEKALSKATSVNGLFVRREIRTNIRTAKYALDRPGNAPLTSFIKGSTKPLVDRGELFKAISSRKLNPTTVEVGVKKGSPHVDIAVVTHEGAIIPVTKKMRGLFARLADVSAGKRSPNTLTGRALELWERRPEQGGWKALKAGTTAIKIPKRPYIKEVVEHYDVRAHVFENWKQAAAAGLADVPPKLK